MPPQPSFSPESAQPPAGEVLTALRWALLRPGAVSDTFHPLDVGDISDGQRSRPMITFRWRQDPAVYAIDLPGPTYEHGSPLSPFHGQPLTGLQHWAAHVAPWLREMVQTGFVRRAHRTPITTGAGHLVHLATDVPALDVLPAGYYISPVSWRDADNAAALFDQPGRGLSHFGLDVDVPRRAAADGRLVSWVLAYVDNASGMPVVGHAVTVRPAGQPHAVDPSQEVALALLQTSAGTPTGVGASLAFHALRDAAEAGAVRATTTLTHPALTALGFTHTNAGSDDLALDLPELRVPDLTG